MCVREWTKDMYIEVDNREVVTASDLGNYEYERIRCIRKLNLINEASLDKGRNLYEILRLNFTDVRNLEKTIKMRVLKMLTYEKSVVGTYKSQVNMVITKWHMK